jgi:hypothetical protein
MPGPIAATDHAARRSAPAGVGRGDAPPHRVHQQHGQAVGGLDPEQQASRARPGRVRFRRLVPGRGGHARAVHLP